MSSSDYVTEQCGCGASVNLSASGRPTWLAEQLATWRREHRHDPVERRPGVDFPPVPQGSSAQVELAPQYDHDTRPPLGFTGGNAR